MGLFWLINNYSEQILGWYLQLWRYYLIFASMKIKNIDQTAESVCELMNLLSNRHRLMILCFLTESERSVGELADCLDVREAVVSQHLAILRRERIVKARRDGQTMYYQIIREDVGQLLEFLYETYCSPTAKKTKHQK